VHESVLGWRCERQRTMKTVMCIDDQADCLEIRKAFLEASGYRALIASSGPEGLEITAREHPDVVILDYKMQGMSGVEVAAQLRRLAPRLPLIMLTGYAQELPDEAPRLFNRIISKGHSARELLAAIEALIGPSDQKPTLDPGYSDALLDMSLRQAMRARNTIASSRKAAEEVRARLASGQSQPKASQRRKRSTRPQGRQVG
jgi:CheY-like chemotaxis protein